MKTKPFYLPGPRFADEKTFLYDFNVKTVDFFRRGSLLGILLYGSYFPIDLYVTPDIKLESFLIRLVFVPLAVLAAYPLSYKKWFNKWQQPVLFYVFSVPVSATFMLMYLTESRFAFLLFPTLMLVIIYFSLVMRFTYKWSLLSSLACALSSIAAISVMELDSEVAVMMSMLFCTTVGLTIFGSYFIEESFRVEFSLTRDLKAARDNAEAATKLKDKFVSLVSHDLRGPLGGVRSLLRLVEEDRRDDGSYADTAEQYLGQCIGSLGGLMEMINKLLDISRLQTGKITPEKRFHHSWSITEITVQKLQHTAVIKGVTIKNESDRTQKLLVDDKLIGEVILNLLSNAIKFTPRGGVISIFSPSPLTLAVKDSGIGIRPDVVEHVFTHEVKTTAVGTDGETGSGGMPLCMDIMKAHNGTISIDTGDRGTTITLEFPKVRPVVLVADDQEVYRISIKEQLEKMADVEVVVAGNGRDALKIAEELEPILVITDLHMPVMDGFQLIQKIRNGRKTSTVPVIVNSAMSSSASPSDGTMIDSRTYAFELGASDFIEKPLVPNDFVPRVSKYLP